MNRYVLGVLLALSLVSSAAAVNPEEQLADPRLEARAIAISSTLRCVVCQNQTIDDSDAALAADLRVLLRERLSAGDTDKQAADFLVARYGEYVLLNPPFKFATVALWLGPFAALLISIGGFIVFMRRRSDEFQGTTLSAEESRQLNDILTKEIGS